MRASFSADELYVLAELLNKSAMYGIPDAFSGMTDSETAITKREILDRLQDEGILQMDFDGRLTAVTDIQKICDFYCDCSACLTYNNDNGAGEARNLIFWRNNNSYMMAEAIDDAYRFKQVSADEILKNISCTQEKDTGRPEGGDIAIPQIILKKVKRLVISGKESDATRLLRQNGCSERAAAVICDGLAEKAQYIRLMLTTPTDGSSEVSFIRSRGVRFELTTQVVGLRTCTVFEELFATDASRKMSKLISDFAL